MVEFKTWRDAYLFLLNYGNFTCLNCKYCGHNLDLDRDHTDEEYTHHFCKESVSMVSFEYMFVCEKWINQDTGEVIIGKEDECIYNLSENVINKLNGSNKKWTFEEIEELINEEESTE